MGAASTQTAVKEYSITQLTKNGVLTIQEKNPDFLLLSNYKKGVPSAVGFPHYCSATMSYKNSQYHPTNAA